MFRGGTALPPAERLDVDLAFLKHRMGADSIQFYDHNFFDREVEMVPVLEVLARHALPWWCYARADALVNLSADSWKLVRKSRLRMAYIGAETPNDKLLKSIRKGTRSDQTLEVAELCRRNGVIPELSFMVAPPEDPDGETERTFDFIRQVKKVNPDAEIIVYIYTPLPAEQRARRRASGARATSRHSREPGDIPTHTRGMDTASVGGLCLSCRRALDERPAAKARAGLRHRIALPLSRPCRTRDHRAGRRRHCAGSRAGAIRGVATTGPGSCARRRISSACSILAPRASDARARHQRAAAQLLRSTRGDALANSCWSTGIPSWMSPNRRPPRACEFP